MGLRLSMTTRVYRIEWEAEITGGGVGKWVKNKRKVWNKLEKFTQFQS